MLQSPIQQRFAYDLIGAALIRARLPYDSPIRQKLNEDAEIVGPPGDGILRMRDSNGDLVSVDTRIQQLKADLNFRECFPDPPTIARGNLEEIRDNFDLIARGEVEVVK